MSRKVETFNDWYGDLFGLLWRVREDLWQERLKHYDRNSTRQWHPGLTIKRGGVSSILDKIPALLGRSRGSRSDFPVANVTRERPDQMSFFGRLIAPLRVPDITDPAHDCRRDTLKGYFLDRKRVVLNFDKPSLDDAEKKRLAVWLKSKGLSA